MPRGFGSPQLVQSGDFDEIAAVVDSNGHLHIAAGTGTAVWYLTNRTGNWTATRALGGTTYGYGDPTIALDARNHVSIAAVRWAEVGDNGIWLVTDKGRPRGTFAANPTRIAPNGNGEPALKVFNGKLFLVDVKTWCCVGDGTVQLRTNASGTWTVSTIGRDQNPSFRMTPDGFARVAYERGEIQPGIYFAAAGTHAGNFTRSNRPTTSLASTSRKPEGRTSPAADQGSTMTIGSMAHGLVGPSPTASTRERSSPVAVWAPMSSSCGSTGAATSGKRAPEPIPARSPRPEGREDALVSRAAPGWQDWRAAS